eukprot:4912026-Karenia_brevis.AAC.1
MGDVLSVGEARVHTIFRRLPSDEFVLITAGSPCQDVSGLNATRRGLSGNRSKFFFHVVRRWQL